MTAAAESYDDTLSYNITPLCHTSAQLTFERPATIFVDGREPDVPSAESLAACPECGAIYAGLNKGPDLRARRVENDDVEGAFHKLRMTLGEWPTYKTNDDGDRECVNPECKSTEILSDGENDVCNACGRAQ